MTEVSRLYSARDMADALFQSGAVLVGKNVDEFPTKNGGRTGVKWDIENVLAHPKDHKRTVLRAFGAAAYQNMAARRFRYDRIVGIPNGMNTFASSLADMLSMGQLLITKAEVEGGTGEISGDANVDQHHYKLMFVEDVLTTGKSVADTAKVFDKKDHEAGLVLALMTRNKHAVETLADKLHTPVRALYTSVELAKALVKPGGITEEQLSWIEADFEKPIAKY